MTHEELEQYINNFQPNQREQIAKAIIDSELLRKAFETSEGKAILNSAVDLVSSNVNSIVRSCSKTAPEAASVEIYSHANEINTIYKLMTDWATILMRGTEHKDKAERR
jgi:hypothetical protein